MKLIASRTRVLENENAALNLEVASLKAELRRAKEMYQQRWTERKGHGQAPSVPINLQSSRLPSYLQPTAASASRARPDSGISNNRIGKGISRSVQSVKRLEYDDGRLVDREAFKNANFMKPTGSSLLKTRGGGWCVILNKSNCGIEPIAASQPDSPRHNGVSWACGQCDRLERCYEDETDQSLEVRSRLRDDSFFQTSVSKCPVPFRTQNRLLRAALRLAQETLWTTLRSHWPHIQRNYYLEGPEQVKFGRDELYSGCLHDHLFREANEICGQPRYTVVSSVLRVVDLRNAVCHPSQNSTEEVDRLLQRAQDLAVTLQDERRAFKVRALRDELQSTTVKAYEDIKTLGGLATLPFAKPWPLYLQRFFVEVNGEVHCGRPSKYPDEAVQAARDWKLLYIRPREWHPGYLSNVAKAKSFMRSTSSGR